MISIVQYIAKAISFVSLAIIVYGMILAIIAFFRNEKFRDKDKIQGLMKIRAFFGGYLLLGLEFLIGADIIRTVIDPTYQELIILGGIVILRTILSFFLNKETRDLD